MLSNFKVDDLHLLSASPVKSCSSTWITWDWLWILYSRNRPWKKTLLSFLKILLLIHCMHLWVTFRRKAVFIYDRVLCRRSESYCSLNDESLNPLVTYTHLIHHYVFLRIKQQHICALGLSRFDIFWATDIIHDVVSLDFTSTEVTHSFEPKWKFK